MADKDETGLPCKDSDQKEQHITDEGDTTVDHVVLASAERETTMRPDSFSVKSHSVE